MNPYNNTDTVLQVGVKVLLKNKEEKYLLVERNTKTYKDVSTSWDIVGGRINVGSTLLQNLEREVYEETKLRICSTPKLVYAQDIILDKRHVVRITYIADCEGEVVLDMNENLRYKWVSVDEIKHAENLDQYLQVVLDKLV